MWSELWVALSLVLVIEGLIPALSPPLYRRVLLALIGSDDRSIRITGLATMIAGAALLFLLRH